MEFDNSFFFSEKFLNLKKNKSYLKYFKKCKKSSIILQNEFKKGTNEVLNSFKLTYQKKIDRIRRKINLDKNKKTVVIGMGGSSAGAKAIASYLNQEIIFFDNLDYEYLYNFIKKKNIFNYNYFLISKSGDTFETLALTNILIKNILKRKKNYALNKIIYVIAESKNSFLVKFARKYNLTLIKHNENIGGRYSALSETGMLPINKFNKKIYKSTEDFIKLLKNTKHNLSPITNASLILYYWKHKKFKTYANLIYDYRFKHFSYWFHQLHAESLGKNGDGLLPYTSICPKDHHSMMQLFLDGPKDKIFNIFKPPLKKYEYFSNFNFNDIEKHKPETLLIKQFNAVIKCFRKNKIPHRVIEFKDFNNPKNILQLISYFILETLILGYSAKVNPYDQPSVQQIKDFIFKV